MMLAEKILALRALDPFSRLRPEELLMIATATTVRDISAGAVLVRRGSSLQHLFIRVSGSLVNEAGTVLQPVLGTTVLLTGCEPPYTVLAGPSGYRGLCVSRANFLTIVNECPLLLMGFFQMPIVGGPGFTPAEERS